MIGIVECNRILMFVEWNEAMAAAVAAYLSSVCLNIIAKVDITIVRC